MLVGCTIAVNALVAFLQLALGLHAHAAVPKRRAWLALVSAHRCWRLHALRSSARDKNEFALHVQEPRDALQAGAAESAPGRALKGSDARAQARTQLRISPNGLCPRTEFGLQTELANPDMK